MIGSTVFVMVAVIAFPVGQITATSSAVRIERGGQPLTVDLRSGVEPGDRLTTGPGGGAALFLYDGHSLYVGGGAALQIAPDGAPRLRLERGELRATVESTRGLTILAGPAQVRVGRGTVWAGADANGIRFRVEHGQAEAAASGRPPVTITADQQVTVAVNGTLRGPTPADPAAWSLRVGAVQLAGAAADSRRSKQGQLTRVNDEVAAEFASSQLGPLAAGAGGTLPGTTPPSQAQPRTTPAEGTLPGTTPSEATAATQPVAEAQPSDEAYQPVVLSQTNSSFSGLAGSLALGGASGAFSFAGSGGLGSDAQQDSRNPAFPGNIYLVTALSRYSLEQVRLGTQDTSFPTDREYFSIGLGPPPTGRVVTNFLTGTGAVPSAIRIPHFGAYVLQLSQYNIPDPGTSNPVNSGFTGISGLLGPNPLSPQIQGATPLLDPRAAFNNRATFALGEFALQRDPQRPSVPQIEIRRSDQDRLIVPGTGPADPVTPNPQIFPRYANVPDPKFFPEFPNGVKVPLQGGFQPAPTLAQLDLLRKAAVTTLLADKLLDFSHRTGQTLFVVDGQIINTAGYRRSYESPRPTPAGPGAAADHLAALPGPSLGPTRPAVEGMARNNPAGRSQGPSLRSFGPRPDATRSGTAAQVAELRRAARHR